MKKRFIVIYSQNRGILYRSFERKEQAQKFKDSVNGEMYEL